MCVTVCMCAKCNWWGKVIKKYDTQDTSNEIEEKKMKKKGIL